MCSTIKFLFFHLGIAAFDNHVTTEVLAWERLYKVWLEDFPCDLIVVHYEHLLHDLEEQLRRIGLFLGVDPQYLHGKHMDCVVKNAKGRFKRKGSVWKKSLYTAAMNRTIDSHLRNVDMLLINRMNGRRIFNVGS